jgi:hypothetical protein
MHTVIRTYTCPPEVLTEGRPKLADLEATMRQIPGFVSYSFLETPEGLTTITTTDDETGADESMGQAVAWVKKNLTETGASLGAPVVTRGETLIAANR